MSDRSDTCVIDLWFRRYIIFSKRHLTGHFNDWRAVIWHELAHFRNKDALFFHFAGITGFILLACFAFVVAIFIDITFTNPGQIWRSDAGELTLAPLLFIAGPVPVILLVGFWLRRSLHLREYRADAEALRVTPAAFKGWLRRAADFEADNPTTLKNFKTRFLFHLTHPSFADRQAAAENGLPPNTAIIWREATRSVGLLIISLLVAYANYEMGQIVNRGDIVNPMFAWLNLAFMIVCMSIGFSALSVSTMEILNQRGRIQAFLYSQGFALFAWLLLFVNYWASIIFGYNEDVTQGLPPNLDNNDGGGALLVAIIFVLSALISFSLNWLLHHFLASWRYNFFVHFLFGIIILLGMFLIPKGTYYVLFLR
ncbi:MAG: M48 family metalloprotease [Pseudomonadota bacterium]